MPDEGGYVTWVRRAFGPFWGVPGRLVVVDRQLRGRRGLPRAVRRVPEVLVSRRWRRSSAGCWPSLFIVVLTALNVARRAADRTRGGGARRCSRCCRSRSLVVVGLAAATQAPWRPLVAEGQTVGAPLGLGLAVVMWNYSGWDTPSTCLGETKRARARVPPRALPGPAGDRRRLRAAGRRGARHRRHRLVDVGHRRPARAGGRGGRAVARPRRRRRRRGERGRAVPHAAAHQLPAALRAGPRRPHARRPGRRSTRASARRGWRSSSRPCSTPPSPRSRSRS